MDERISVEADAGGPRLPRPVLIGAAAIAALLIGFLFTSDIGEPDQATSTTLAGTTTQATSTTSTTQLEVEVGIRSIDVTLESVAFGWQTIDLPEAAPFIAAMGTFLGEPVALGGDLRRGFFHDLVLTGRASRSPFGSWFEIGAVTDEPLRIMAVDIGRDAVVIAGRAVPSADFPRGEVVILHSEDGVAWIESRFAEPGEVLFLGVAVEREMVSVFAAGIDSDLEMARRSLPVEYQRLIAEGLATVSGFDGSLIVFGPLGVELARFSSDLVPPGGEISQTPSFRPLLWRGPRTGPLEPASSPFGDGFADAVREDELGDLVAQVFNGANYDEWTSIGDGSWEQVVLGVDTGGRAVGGLGHRSLYLDDFGVTPRLLMVENREVFRLDFGNSSLRVETVFGTPHGVLVGATTGPARPVVLDDRVTYTDGPWTVAIPRAGSMVISAADGSSSISRPVDNIWPVEYDTERRVVTIRDLGGVVSADLDIGLLADAEARFRAEHVQSALLFTRDLQSWELSIPATLGRVVTSAATPNEAYIVIRQLNQEGIARHALLVADR